MVGGLSLLLAYLLCLKYRAADTRRRTLNLLIALDQFVYVLITFGNGHADETMSAAAYRLWLERHWAGSLFKPAIDWLFSPFEADHCYHAFVAELMDEQLPGVYKMKFSSRAGSALRSDNSATRN